MVLLSVIFLGSRLQVSFGEEQETASQIAAMSSSLTLPFLRPMALPRPSTLNRFLGIAKASTTAIPPAPPASTTKPEERKYWVTKTGTKGIPVYHLKKRGGNLHQTKVRRIEGDIMAMKTDLQRALGLEDKEIVINQLTHHIIIKVRKYGGQLE